MDWCEWNWLLMRNAVKYVKSKELKAVSEPNEIKERENDINKEILGM